MVIVERVEGLTACPAHTDQARATQQAKLVRDGRFGQFHQRRKVADASFTVGERIQQPHASRVAEEFERLGHVEDRPRAQQTRRHVVESSLIGTMPGLAGFESIF